ncbi:YckD family protein [Calderihabitans maritimus]|uniref:DUF2680 domain-containing protein n=1 Tax=Calderihabitans maritimus TaxID=1246530 RepID=A0A1Z5HU04_9FIRM|nr:YckD family protein [Calderihabitans maritimus]GAW93019.1 hypothetical protein KKC1_21630 [Calderihabitans maritimus]
MRKLLVLTLISLMVLLVTVPAALAAMTDQQKEEIDSLFQKILEIKQQIIQKYVEAGELTPEQGQWLQQHAEEMYQFHKANGFVNHCGGMGYSFGMM